MSSFMRRCCCQPQSAGNISFEGDNIDSIKINLQGHVLIVTRFPDASGSLVKWARKHRKKGSSVGMLLMADELNEVETELFASFDYVFRHYFFKHLRKGPGTSLSHFIKNWKGSDAKIMHLYTLGNISCGSSANPWPPKQ